MICCKPGILVLTSRLGTIVARSVALAIRERCNWSDETAVTFTPTFMMYSWVRSAVTTISLTLVVLA